MFMQECFSCNQLLPSSYFYYARRTNKPMRRCKDCHKILSVNWRNSNTERIRELHLTRSFRKKSQVIEHYSGGKNCCACCGESTFEFMSVDHLNNDGNLHRAKTGLGGNMLYNWLVKNNFPPGYQILCLNCNQAKGNFGQCPHQGETIFTKFLIKT